MYRVNRDKYLDFLIRWKDKKIIKVISGIRRCGKSTLFDIYKDYLREEGIAEEQMISLNFEDLEFESLKDYRMVYEYLKPYLELKKQKYIFLDEIQHVEQFEKLADGLFVKENVDLYITGSNAYFMSGELATLLSGRYVELKMLPLSFYEYHDAMMQMYPDKSTSLMEHYNAYLHDSSFPYTLQLAGREIEIREYLNGIYSSILLKDIVARLKISDVMLLERIIHFVFDNIGNILSIRKIANTITSGGRKVDAKTVEKYLHGLMDSLMIYQVKRYNIKGKQYLMTNEKYYLADLGLRYFVLGDKGVDQGHILENIVYLELIRRGYQVFVGTIPNGEIDFVAMRQGEIEYYQVSATVMDIETLKRELSPLQKITDQFPKYLLTLDVLGAGTSHEGIRQLNVLEWLLSGGGR